MNDEIENKLKELNQLREKIWMRSGDIMQKILELIILLIPAWLTLLVGICFVCEIKKNNTGGKKWIKI